MAKPASMTAPGRKLDSLQAVRALAFLGVFTCHTGFGDFGAWAVSVFFILSGFLMMYVYHSREPDSSLRGCVGFGIRKIRKLYPLHILTLVFTVIFVEKVFFEPLSLSGAVILLGKVFLNVTLIQAWIPSPYGYFALNGVAWYLSASLFIYGVFPKLLPKLKKLDCKKSLALMVGIYLVQLVTGRLSDFVVIPNFYFDNFAKWFTYIFPVFRLGDFVIGCCLGNLYLRMDFKLGWLWATVLELFTFALIYYAEQISLSVYGIEWLRYSLLYTPTSVCLVLLFALKKGWISQLLSSKPITYIGDLSPYAYLIHSLVIKGVAACLPMAADQMSGKAVNAILGLILVLLASELYKRKS